MARYIDISDLHIPEGIFTGVNVPKLLAWIHSITPAEVREAKNGKWITHFNEDTNMICTECSNCGFPYGYHRYNFCPNCGAKMIKGK